MHLYESIMLDAVVFVALFVVGLYLYLSRNFGFWKKHGFPYEKPTGFVGNVKELALLRNCLGESLQKLYELHSDKPFVGFFSFDKPGLLVRDLEIVKNILVKDTHNFTDHVISISDGVDTLAGRCLPNLKGQKWRYYRTNLTATFTTSKMKKMLCLVNKCGDELVQYIKREIADGAPVSVKEAMGNYTTDVIACCGFGIESNSLKNPDAEFRRYLRRVFDYSLRKGLFSITVFLAPHLQNFLKLRLADEATTKFLRDVTWSTVAYREKHEVTCNDYLHYMMELRNKGLSNITNDKECDKSIQNDQQFQIDGDDFVAQCFIFMAAGFETTSSTMSFLLYELALQPELQHRLRAEMRTVLAKHRGEITYDAIQEMTYLDMVLSETLRKYPVLPLLDRMCINDYKLPHPSGKGTLTLPEGTGVYIPILGIHKDPKYYPDPEKFDPQRFTEENKQKRQDYSYIPFGVGPRFCIGMRFGLMSAKSGLIHILSHYELTPCEDTPLPLVFDSKAYLLSAVGALPLTFKKIKDLV
ncbi:cytochrome P450 6j1-like [Periplaneta americana]|uniref:cytochrome P450 6j1-like n=1 Tax=Periplaneta americana TaxID=6978 RepID=UPI0037E7E0F5